MLYVAILVVMAVPNDHIKYNTNNMRRYTKYTEFLFRAGIAAVFLYFGIMALRQPEAQGALWIRPEFIRTITSLVSIKVFMLALGIVQIVVGCALVAGVALRAALLIAAALLIGIIINLSGNGINDVVLRDIAILTGVIYLLSKK